MEDFFNDDNKIKLAVLFDNFGPYHIARLTAASKLFSLLAVEHRATSKEYQWNATNETSFERVTLLQSKNPHVSKRSEYTPVQITLDEHRPDAIVVPGWVTIQAKAGLNWALRNKVPVVVMSASQEIDFPRSRWKEWIKSRFIRLCSAGMVGGAPHRAYLAKLGMPLEHIHVGYDVVDNAHFAKTRGKNSESESTGLNLIEGEHSFFLCTVRFIDKKNLRRLIEAFARYREIATSANKACTPWDLVILGDGEIRPTLEALSNRLGLQKFVHMPGFKQYGELPKWYSEASCFVLPSTTEQWGLVVNEAMAAGLPVLVSNRCGCAPDLVDDGRNGFTFDPYDVPALANLMLQVASPSCDRAAMGRASQEIIAHWSPETFASNLEAAVNTALKRGSPKARVLDRLLLWALSFR